MLIIRKWRDHRSAKEQWYLVGESNPRREIEDGRIHSEEGDQMKEPSGEIAVGRGVETLATVIFSLSMSMFVRL